MGKSDIQIGDRAAAMAVFCRVVETGGISAAARALGVAPSSVSRRLSLLEADLGISLLNRTTRSLSLTEAGRSYLEAARQALAEIDRAHRLAATLNETPRGTLRVTMPLAFAARHGQQLLATYHAVAPEVTVELLLSDTLLDLANQDIDIAVRSGNADIADLVAVRLTPVVRHVIASPTYLLAHGEPRTPEELAQHRCLIFRPGGALTVWRFTRGNESRAVTVSGPLICNNAEVIVAACAAGMGLALLPTWQVGAELRNGRVRAVLDDWAPTGPSLSSHLWALYPHNRRGLSKVRLFVDLLKQTAEQAQ